MLMGTLFSKARLVEADLQEPAEAFMPANNSSRTHLCKVSLEARRPFDDTNKKDVLPRRLVATLRKTRTASTGQIRGHRINFLTDCFTVCSPFIRHFLFPRNERSPCSNQTIRHIRVLKHHRCASPSQVTSVKELLHEHTTKKTKDAVGF